MKTIPLTQGKVALVDDVDYEWMNQWKWYAYRRNEYTWYALRMSSSGKKRCVLSMHRVIMGLTDRAIEVDHADNDGLNNQRGNLRVASHKQNQQNKPKRDGFSSKYKGVFWYKRDGKWTAQVRINGARTHLGYFTSEIEAASAYNVAASKCFGEFAKLNDV